MSSDLDIEAAEYVLGTLDRDERETFAARISADPEARSAVQAWELRLAGLASRVQPVAPPPSVWTEIERALNHTATAPVSFKVIQGGGKSLSDANPSLKRSLTRWRAAALISSGLAAALLVFIGSREMNGDGTTDGASFVAAINRGGDKPALLVRVDLKTRTVHVRPVSAEAPDGKSLELWYINDGKPPRSMGVVDRSPIAMPIPNGVHADAATFAVSIEPRGGSTTGSPTGPVVYSGELVKE